MRDTKDGETLTAWDIKERLCQNLPPRRLLLWPPNLFAFTSYILSLSGAYQIVVSPPPGYHWPPDLDDLVESLAQYVPDRADELRKSIADAHVLAGYLGEGSTWACLVRETGLRWRQRLADLHGPDLDAYMDAIHGETGHDDGGVPIFLLACWMLFEQLYCTEDCSADISELLCNSSRDETTPRKWLATTALVSMHAIADETCVGWGLQAEPLTVHFPSLEVIDTFRAECRSDATVTAEQEAGWRNLFASKANRAVLPPSDAQQRAEQKLYKIGTLATISTLRARVLPKRHNPDVGITLRSLSSNLAFHRSAIDVVWIDGQRDHNPLAERLAVTSELKPALISVLLMPFPMVIKTSDFRPHVAQHDSEPPPVATLPKYAFFTCTPERFNITELINKTLAKAQAETDFPVDLVILPELALTQNMRRDMEDEILTANASKPVSFYVAGVWERTDGKQSFPQDNMVCYKAAVTTNGTTRFLTDEEMPPGRPFKQYKHHRWQLNRSQIQQYGLSHALDRENKWWEAINVGRRRVSFVNLGERLTVCPLICEDLARQDPIADLIRHVGPSLVVTILMDGPQHKDRWASRYAGILAEDPGSAVIALTSFGMVRRWSAPHSRLSRVVALWNDREGPRELELEPGAHGMLLSLSVTAEREPVADGRRELHATSSISLVDVVQVYPM